MKNYNNEKAIISLTSWKGRINTVHLTIKNLLKMCPKFHIVLVLSEEEFPLKEQELPKSLLKLLNKIEILWIYKNYKSFKKTIFTGVKYPNVPIISADDDLLYKCNYAEILYNIWLLNKNSVITNDGIDFSCLHICRGPNTLYPPGYLTKLDKLLNAYETHDLHNEDLFFAVYNKLKFINVIDLKQKSFYDIHSDYTSTVYYANNIKDEFDVYVKLFPY